MQAYDASNILAKIETLERETLDQLEAAKGDSDIKHVLAAVREQRGNLELAARIAKLINEAPTINVLNAPYWIEVRSAVVEALQAHPSARMAVLRALEGVEERMPSGTPSVAGDLMMALDRVSFARALGFEPDE